MLKKTLAVISLGCFRNTYDSEIITTEFLDRGFVLKDNFKICHTLIINTCGFIDKAKEESLQVIKEAIDLKRKNKIKRIIVYGCLVQRYRKALDESFSAIDNWQGVINFSRYPRKAKLTPSFIDFLKISEGCLNKCSFCAIPLIKGSLRSRPLKEVLKEVRYLDQRGVKELNIIGQDITSWGKDFISQEGDLTTLMKAILKVTKNIHWLRLIYTYPRHFSDSLIDLIAKEERVCKYIDLPIQHINDRILKLMNRGLSKKEITTLIQKIREKIPNCAIRTSVIAGFPTEGQEEFEELLSFLDDIKFERLGAFTYSQEEDTPAYHFRPQVHQSTKKRRYKEIMLRQKKIAYQVNENLIGQEVETLIEKKENNIYTGRTQYDASEVDGVVFIKRKNLTPGEFYRAKIIDAYDYDLVAI